MKRMNIKFSFHVKGEVASRGHGKGGYRGRRGYGRGDYGKGDG